MRVQLAVDDHNQSDLPSCRPAGTCRHRALARGRVNRHKQRVQR